MSTMNDMSMVMPRDDIWSVPGGAPVFTVDDLKLGRVIGDGPLGLVVGSGFLLHRRFHVRLGDVARYEAGTLFLRLSWQQVLEQNQRPSRPASRDVDPHPSAMRPKAAPSCTPSASPRRRRMPSG